MREPGKLPCLYPPLLSLISCGVQVLSWLGPSQTLESHPKSLFSFSHLCFGHTGPLCFLLLRGQVSKCTSPEGPVGGGPARLLGFQNTSQRLLIWNQEKHPNCTGIGMGEETPFMRRQKFWEWDSEQGYQEVMLSCLGTPYIKAVISTPGDSVPLRSLAPSP